MNHVEWQTFKNDIFTQVVFPFEAKTLLQSGIEYRKSAQSFENDYPHSDNFKQEADKKIT